MIDPRLKGKIEGLRAKTRAAGCTEAEALAAAELAAKLMAEAGISEADLRQTEAGAPIKTSRPTWRSDLEKVIAHCTNCAAINVFQHSGNEIVFFGRDPGPEIALYLRDVCVRAVEKALSAFKGGEFYKRRRSIATRRKAAADFANGMVLRLCRRLLELFRPLVDQQAIVESRQALERRFSGSVDFVRPKQKTKFDAALTEGWRVGAEVALNHGVAETERKALS